MSEKDKYKITQVDEKTWKVEKEDDYFGIVLPEASCNTTFRERTGYKMLRMSRSKKIILILLGDIYGVLYRWGANMGISYLFSLAQFFGFIFYSVIAIITPIFLFNNNIEYLFDDISVLYFFIVYSVFLITDLLCILFTGDIRILGRRHYKNFQD